MLILKFLHLSVVWDSHRKLKFQKVKLSKIFVMNTMIINGKSRLAIWEDKMTEEVKLLDACCGSRMFWFDKNESHTTFMDIRKEKFEIHGKKVHVDPDVIGDFRDMPFENNTFNLVVFDPPHLKWAGPNSIMKAQYGQLDKETWSEDLAKGFEECMRVLKTGGTLIFKWSDCQVNVKEILEVIPFKPLFGQRRGTTHWMTFVKFEEVD
nr:MAG TPA: Methyltransferase domain [Caudoviricetes sp.]